MEIKKRLNAIAKCMTPEIEAMNIATEIKLMLDRIEGLVRYAEEKIAAGIERAKSKEKTISQKAKEQQAADQKVITDHQTAESDANLADQQEAFDERNKKPGDEDPIDDGDAKDQTDINLEKNPDAPDVEKRPSPLGKQPDKKKK